MLLSTLKRAFDNKNLYFTINYSKKNLDFVHKLLFFKIICNFYVFSNQKQNFLLIFPSYDRKLNPSLNSIFSKKLLKKSKPFTDVYDPNYLAVNFIFDLELAKTKRNSSFIDLKKTLKFR